MKTQLIVCQRIEVEIILIFKPMPELDLDIQIIIAGKASCQAECEYQEYKPFHGILFFFNYCL